MPALTNKKNSLSTKKPPASVADIVVRRSMQTQKKAPMLASDIVAAGAYHSRIIAVEDARSDEGKLMADVTYRLTNADGKSADARIRYPVPGFHLDRLMDALVEAGLPEESSLTDAVGIEEEVIVTFPHDGALGKIKSRRPANQVVPAAAKKPVSKQMPPKNRKALVEDDEGEEVIEDDDSEFDDFFEEELD